jgi:hypothetical protein
MIEKKNSIEKKFQKEIHENIIRKIYRFIYPYLSYLKGAYYGTLHTLLILACCYILLFTNNLSYLIILLLIISLDAISIVFLHDCPLTLLEKKYIGISGREIMNKIYQKINIFYHCNHLYESQLELLINVWALIVLKILFIIIFKIK